MFQKIKNDRIKIVLITVIIILIIIILRVFYIQIFKYDELNELANDLWSRNLPITAHRGEILDRNGKVLATNITTTSLVLVPSQIINKEEVAKNLANILQVDYEDMLSHVNKKTSIERVHPEGRNLDSEISDQINNLNYDGVYLLRESKRYYPHNELLANTLGYVGIDNQGLSGLELEYDEYLTGENGAIKYYSDGQGNRLEVNEVYQAPTSGINIQLTIDLDIQLAVERELNNAVSKYDPDNALILVMDPSNGEVLAMSSRPTFDSNNYQDYSEEVINRNLPIWMTYEPGSTFKIITLASSLEEETINLFEDTYYDSGSITVAGTRIGCWKHEGHGLQTMLQVVENSCNPGFVTMGQELGAETLFRYIKNFGFGEKTGIDLNGESIGIMFKEDDIGPLELATTSFGQGISVTPIQQVNAISAAINGGTLYQPQVVKNFLEPVTNTVIKTIDETIIRENIISEETSNLVRYSLESVVANGTGKNAYIENYKVGGKTGTAQKVENGAYLINNYIVSFIGFMPTDKPEYIIYVAVDNPKGVTQYGGTVAAPIAKNIFEEIISINNLEESEDTIPKEYTWLDQKYIQMPNVTGLPEKEAASLLKDFKIEYTGSGDNIIYQSPKEGLFIKEGSTIKLLLN